MERRDDWPVLLQKALHLARLGSWVWDLQGDEQDWSTDLYEIFGLDGIGCAATYQTYLDRVHPADRLAVTNEIERARVSCRGFAFDHRIVRPDGSVRLVHSCGEVEKNAAGAAVRMFGTCQDVSERERGDEGIRRALSLLRATLEANADAILVVDNERQVVTFNRNFVELWQLTPECAGARDYETILSTAERFATDPVEYRRRIDEIFAVPDGDSVDELRLNDGRVIERMSRPQRLGDQIVGRVWMFRDRTEFQRSLDREQDARKAAEEAIGACDQFLSVVSHELRTPITSLQLNVQTLLAGVATGGTPLTERDPMAKPLRAVERQSRKLTALINDMLDVARLRQHQLDLFLSEVDLADATRDAFERMAADCLRAGCRCEIQAQPGIVGMWDRGRVEQIVTNLLSNAFRYGAGRRVRVAVSRSDGMARLVVEDEGPGIPPEQLQGIFGRFVRAGASRNYGGLGLGLFIVWEIVTRLYGSVRAENRTEGGARFTVELPVMRGDRR